MLSRIASRNRLVGAIAAVVFACCTAVESGAEGVPVRFAEGVVHGFLVLRTLEGRTIADGDLTQVTARGGVIARLTFRFRDGSLYDETAVFTQRGQFRLASYHLVQRGPSFPQPLEMTIDVATGQITVHYRDDDGDQKTESEHMELPSDLANGFIQTLLKNVRPAAPVTLSFVAATPKPRLVKLEATPAPAEDRLSIGRRGRRATHYVIKVDIGGLAGVIAPLVGKKPPDSHVWIMTGDVPAFVRAEQAFYVGGPIWRVELTTPVWPRGAD